MKITLLLGSNRNSRHYARFSRATLWLMCLWGLPCYPAAYFSVTDLGQADLVWPGGGAYGINASGEAVGIFGNPGGLIGHASLYSGGVTTDLGTLGGVGGHNYSSASGINDSGQVVGWAYNASGQQIAFRTAPNTVISPGDGLGTLGGDRSFANALNNLGQVVGYSKLPDTQERAFRTTPQGVITSESDLGVLAGGIRSNAHGINDSGQVVGSSLGSDGFYRAFRTGPNLSINPLTDDIGTLGGPSASAAAINSTGQVVGRSATASGVDHAFRTSPNAAINSLTDDLGALGSGVSVATAINGQGDVVGRSQDASGFDRAFLYTDSLGMQNLNDLIEPASGWVLTYAYGISDAGQIVGSGNLYGVGHAFLLTVVPEPSTFALTALGATALMVARRRR